MKNEKAEDMGLKSLHRNKRAKRRFTKYFLFEWVLVNCQLTCYKAVLCSMIFSYPLPELGTQGNCPSCLRLKYFFGCRQLVGLLFWAQRQLLLAHCCRLISSTCHPPLSVCMGGTQFLCDSPLWLLGVSAAEPLCVVLIVRPPLVSSLGALSGWFKLQACICVSVELAS